MRPRPPPFLLLATATLVAMLVAMPAWARAGGGSSFGSRGARTYALPGPAGVAPAPAPIERGFMPRPQAARPMPYATNTPSRRAPLIGGLLGGLLGAGVFGLAFGHGLFGGIEGMAGIIGFLAQAVLLVLLARLVLQHFARLGPAAPSAPSGRSVHAPPAPPAAPPPVLLRADYETFERLLREVQAAWTAKDQARMRELATPEMVALFGGRLAELARNTHRNSVTDIRLEEGKLSEAWREGDGRAGLDYATVALRFSMVDVTRDARGYVVDGSPDEHVVVTELWTFAREDGGGWKLSAIRQTR